MATAALCLARARRDHAAAGSGPEMETLLSSPAERGADAASRDPRPGCTRHLKLQSLGMTRIDGGASYLAARRIQGRTFVTQAVG